MQSIKVLNTSQVNSIYKYMNTKRKLLFCNANIYFNKKCLENNVIPKYAYTNITTQNKKLTKRIKDQYYEIRIKNEIKFQYIKKQTLNLQLYNLHLENGKNY